MRIATVVIALVVLPTPVATAEEGAYSSHTGVGIALSSPASAVDVETRTSLLMKSTYGLTDWTNWEGPVSLDFRSGSYTLIVGFWT